jgi:peptidoglycan hydrolase-like amidase
MCQFGALGMVKKGKTWEEVAHYYYPGCDIWKIYQ